MVGYDMKWVEKKKMKLQEYPTHHLKIYKDYIIHLTLVRVPHKLYAKATCSSTPL